jgi:hypothetical protein
MVTEPTHGFKWPVRVNFMMLAPSEKVWEVISTPEILELTHPFCKRNPVHTWSGVGSKDTIEYYNGRILSREFYSWDIGLGYDLLIGREGGRKSKVSWRIKSEGEENCTLSITIFPNTLQGLSWIKAMPQYHAIVRPMLKKYLQSVLRGFDYYIRTGKPVSKNQFGTHRWFST